MTTTTDRRPWWPGAWPSPTVSAVTLWTDPYPGAAVATGRLRNVEALYASYVDAYLVWLLEVPIKESSL